MTDETERKDEERNHGAEPDAAVTVEEAGEEAGKEAVEDRDRGESEQLDELRDELGTLKDRHLRLAAEFDNYRKRNERDRQALAARLQLDLVASLLDVLDDLERVAAASPDDGESVVEGVRLVEKKFRSVLEAAGLEALDAEGARFDPEVMEALMMIPTTDPEEDGRVADVFQRGYRFRDVLVRPARVRVLRYEGDESGGEEQ